MTDMTHAVASHYHRPALYDGILAALRNAGKNLNALTPDDLSPIDEFHTRGHAVTVEMAEMLGIRPADRVLDVGCGIGGPSRWLAHTFGCSVTGIDLTPEFCRTAEALSKLLKLERLTTYRQGDAQHMPFADASFDVAWAQNMAMNIENRLGLYREVRRVLKPGGRYAFADIVARSGEALEFPVPWATEPAFSFLLTAEATRRTLEEAGFRIVRWEDTTEKAISASRQRAKDSAASNALNLQYVMGPEFRTKVQNQNRNFETGRVGALQALVQREG